MCISEQKITVYLVNLLISFKSISNDSNKYHSEAISVRVSQPLFHAYKHGLVRNMGGYTLTKLASECNLVETLEFLLIVSVKLPVVLHFSVAKLTFRRRKKNGVTTKLKICKFWHQNLVKFIFNV